MTKLEKVINGLEHCTREVTDAFVNECSMCPYKPTNDDEKDCVSRTQKDALELLKAVPPDAREVWIGSNGAFHWEYTCGACGCGIMRNDRWKTKYCPECGKAVKWDE